MKSWVFLLNKLFFCGRRRESEEISDLKQQKLYLEARVSSLEREIQEIRDGTHQQRIRALDLKHELREVRLGCVTSCLWLTGRIVSSRSGFPLGLENVMVFPVRELSENFEQIGKSGENHAKYWKWSGNFRQISFVSLVIFKGTKYYLIQ